MPGSALNLGNHQGTCRKRTGGREEWPQIPKSGDLRAVRQATLCACVAMWCACIGHVLGTCWLCRVWAGHERKTSVKTDDRVGFVSDSATKARVATGDAFVVLHELYASEEETNKTEVGSRSARVCMCACAMVAWSQQMQ